MPQKGRNTFPTAMVSALYILRGPELAEEFLQTIKIDQTVGAAFPAMAVSCKRMGSSKHVEPRKRSKLDGFSTSKETVIIVRLLMGNEINNSVGVDMVYRCTINSTEQYLLQMTPKSLSIWAGGKERPQIAEVREVTNFEGYKV